MYEKKCTAGEVIPFMVDSENPHGYEAYHYFTGYYRFPGTGS